jgi:hypothetical protein
VWVSLNVNGVLGTVVIDDCEPRLVWVSFNVDGVLGMIVIDDTITNRSHPLQATSIYRFP